MNKLYLSWQDIEELVIDLANHIQPTSTSAAPTLIVGVARGGLIPATMLSYQLCCGYPVPVTSLQASTRHGIEVDRNQIITTVRSWPNWLTNSIVVVDDICDSGKTFDIISPYIPNARYVTLVNKQATKDKTFAPRMVDDDQWVVFPWETD